MRWKKGWALGLLLCTAACEDFCCGEGAFGGSPAVASQVAVRNCLQDRIVAVYKIVDNGQAEFLGDLPTSWPASASQCDKSSNGILMVDLGSAGSIKIHALKYAQIGSTSPCDAGAYDVQHCDDYQRSYSGDPDAQVVNYDIQ